MSVGTIRALPEKAGAANVRLKPVSWLAKIDFIAHLVLDNNLANNVLISILGEQGSGKTTFATLLQTELFPKIKSCVFAASPLFDRAICLQQMGVLLGISGDPSISSFIEHSNAQKTHTVLVIDDAHHLPVAFIEDILKALQQQGRGGYFHVCLVSGFSLVPILNKLAQGTYTDMIHSIEPGG